jgi:membrane protein implicated in regulation of membrane protease activity
METLPWFWIWVILAAALCVGEMFTASFFMLPFAVGAAAAAIALIFGAPIELQFVILIVVSIVALIAMRPLARRVTIESAEKAGADRLVNKIGSVIVGGNAERREFRVLVQNDEWNAVSTDKSILPIGTEVEVLQVDGTHLVVRALQATLQNATQDYAAPGYAAPGYAAPSNAAPGAFAHNQEATQNKEAAQN